MIKEKFRVPGRVKARYVAKAPIGDHYNWCEQNADRLATDIAQGTCEAEDLPPDIRKYCDENMSCFYACEWPFPDSEGDTE